MHSDSEIERKRAVGEWEDSLNSLVRKLKQWCGERRDTVATERKSEWDADAYTGQAECGDWGSYSILSLSSSLFLSPSALLSSPLLSLSPTHYFNESIDPSCAPTHQSLCCSRLSSPLLLPFNLCYVRWKSLSLLSSSSRLFSCALHLGQLQWSKDLYPLDQTILGDRSRGKSEKKKNIVPLWEGQKRYANRWKRKKPGERREHKISATVNTLFLASLYKNVHRETTFDDTCYKYKALKGHQWTVKNFSPLCLQLWCRQNKSPQ